MGRSIRLLLADSHPLILLGLARAFADEPGIQVVGEARNAAEAVAQAQAFEPDVILLDFSMPQGQGAQALTTIKQVAPRVHIIVMTITGWDQDSLAEAMRLGAEAFVPQNSPAFLVAAMIRQTARQETAPGGKDSLPVYDAPQRGMPAS